MESLTSTEGTLALAIAALLLVSGFRFARPERGREWLAFVLYGTSLAATLAASVGHPLGPAAAPGVPLRAAGGAVLVAGLLLAGSAARARRLAAAGAPDPRRPPARARHGVELGLALVLGGQLLRAPSLAGAVATAAAALALAWVALARSGR